MSGSSDGLYRRQRSYRFKPVGRMLFSPPPFDPEKVTLSYTFKTAADCSGSLFPRFYTLTHNDITGQLFLTVGSEYNKEQLSPLYVKFLRDEVIATWKGRELHVFCFVSGDGHWWLAPANLREYIFRREMPLVLDTLRYADKELIEKFPEANHFPVYVHFCGAHEGNGVLSKAHNRTEFWGAYGTAKGPTDDLANNKSPALDSDDSFPGKNRISSVIQEMELTSTGLESRFLPRFVQVRPTAVHAVPVDTKVKASSSLNQQQNKVC